MKASNVRAMTLKNLNQIKRDPRMLALSVVAPIIVTALFGSVFGGDLTNLKVLVVVDDENFDNVIGDQILNDLGENPLFFLNDTSPLSSEVRAAVDNNYSQAAIIFPSSFTEDLLLSEGAKVELYVSYSNPTVASYITSEFQSSFNDVIYEYFKDSQVEIEIDSVYEGAPGPMPGLINISVSQSDEGWEENNNKLSKEFMKNLDKNDTVNIETMDSIKEAKEMVKNGDARALVIIPDDFTYDALVKKEINIEVIYDGAEPQSSQVIKGTLSYYLTESFEDTFDKSAFNMDEEYYNNPDGDEEELESITYFTPAILSFIVFFFGFLLTMLAFIRERKEGTMERILISPLTRDEIILGYILSFSIIAILQATVVIIASILVFNAQIEYTVFSLAQAYLIIYLVVLTALGTGIFLSTLAKTEFQIIQFVPLIILPFMLLSGVWSPVEALPEWLRPLSSFIPLTYANSAMRDILLRGKTILDVIVQVGILAAFASTTILLGILKLNKTIK